jgi:NTP pyrophosphatase (non-canonical NTP hydrolase)
VNLNELVKAAGENAVAHGFRDGDATPEERAALIPQRVALIHSEVSELLEHARNGEKPDEIFFVHVPHEASNKPDGIPAELADIIIRCGDFAHEHGIDLDRAVALKMAYNATRPYKHGRKL